MLRVKQEYSQVYNTTVTQQFIQIFETALVQ